MESRTVPPLGLTRRSAAVNVLLLMDEHRRAAGARLSQLREQRQWSQERLAQEAGLSVKTVGRFERGQHDGRPHTVKALAKALKVEAQAITGPPPPPLGLGDSQLDRLEKKVNELTAIIDQLVTQLTADQVTQAAARATAGTPRRTPGSRRKKPSTGTKRAAG
jgi:transcriptional regulator with XRE-family HTH domain